MQGKQIPDRVLVADELIDSREHLQQDGVICEIDLEKSYDHEHWSFVGSHDKRGSMQERISTTSFSGLVNVSPTRLFKASRCLRQRDTLPFLFTLVMHAMGVFFF